MLRKQKGQGLRVLGFRSDETQMLVALRVQFPTYPARFTEFPGPTSAHSSTTSNHWNQAPSSRRVAGVDQMARSPRSARPHQPSPPFVCSGSSGRNNPNNWADWAMDVLGFFWGDGIWHTCCFFSSIGYTDAKTSAKPAGGRGLHVFKGEQGTIKNLKLHPSMIDIPGAGD